MTLREINRQRMFTALLFCLKNVPGAVLLLLPVLSILTDAFEALINAMLAAEQVQGTVTEGVGATKAEKKLVLFKTASSIGKGLLSYANGAGDTTLSGLITSMLKDLDKIADATFVMQCNTIHEQGVAKVASLAPWGISATVLTAFDLAIEDYSNQGDTLRNKVIQRANATSTIAALHKEATSLLKKQVDTAVGALPDNTTTHDFITEYSRSRVIIDLGHKYTQFKGVTINKETQLELNGVELEFRNAERSIKITANGKYREVINPDIWDIIATKPGFQPFMINGVQIQAGEIKVENIEMKPL